MKKKKVKRKRKHSAISVGHKQVAKVFKKLGYKVVNEFMVNGVPFDIYIKELNLIVEYYGNRWHYNKSDYPPDFYDKVKKRYAWEKWEKDKYKIDSAKEKGFKVEVIWECDWKKLSDKTRFVEKLIKKVI